MTPHFEGRQAVFFDFDGVIVDSFDVKTRAFAALYADDHPHIVKDVIAYHEANGGVSRYKKFEHFENVLLGRAPTQERIDTLADRFATAVVDAVVGSPEIEGAEVLLQMLARRGTPCFVASGTPEEELKEIVERRRLGAYFTAVRGAPAEKSEILAELLAQNGYEPSRCLMVGDAMTDYRAAIEARVPFLGVAPAASPFPDDVPVMRCFAAAVRKAVA